MDNLTICIPTHCIKTETSGQYVGIEQKIPSVPSSKLVFTIIHDLLEKTNLDKNIAINIGFDKRKGRSIDEEYHINLEKLKDYFPNLKVIVNETETEDPIITAPQNFIKLIDSVKTKYYLFWEHDWVFNKTVNIKQIIEELDKNQSINWIKFSQFPVNNTIVSFIPEAYTTKNPSNVIPLVPTTRWSNNPYICRTEIFQKWWKTFIYPTDEEGGFVEGPLNVFYQYYIDKQGLEVALNTFKCFIYGNINDEAIVHHLNGYRVI
jgi:hypothetical protein